MWACGHVHLNVLMITCHSVGDILLGSICRIVSHLLVYSKLRYSFAFFTPKLPARSAGGLAACCYAIAWLDEALRRPVSAWRAVAGLRGAAA